MIKMCVYVPRERERDEKRGKGDRERVLHWLYLFFCGMEQ